MHWKRFAFVAVGILLLLSALPPGATVSAATAVFINEIHYDNTGADANEAVEVAGPAGTNLTGWSLVPYNGANGQTYSPVTNLTGSIPDQGAGFGTLSFPIVGLQNGSPDGIALVNGSTVVQFLSYEGTFAATNGDANGMTSVDIGVSENGTEALGMSLQLKGTGTTYEQFTWNAPSTASLGTVNAGQSFGVVANAPVVANCGAALNVSQGSSGTRQVSASDTDGTVTQIVIDNIAPPQGANSITLANLAPASTTGGTAAADIVVNATGAAGTHTVTVKATNNDATPQTDTCDLTVNITAVLTIGAVQGPVLDTDDGTTHRSPLAPASGNGTSSQLYEVRGVIYQKTLARTASGGNQHGFFMQNTAATDDDNPLSSDGIFVFMGSFTSLIGGYVPLVGDEVILRARVSEFFSLTELSSASLVQVVRSGVNIDTELPAFDVNPPDDIDVAGRYWERQEGMRAGIPAGTLVLDGRNVFPSTMDGEVWVIRANHPIAQRTDPYARRSFRDFHPLDNAPGNFDDGNGYRIILGSLGLKAAANDNLALIGPARTFDSITNSLTGGVYFSFEKYQIQVGQQPVFAMGADPALNAPPSPVRSFTSESLGNEPAGYREYSVATFNIENLYDFRDDPFDGCDFVGNSGCPGVSPPFDYVPESNTAYQTQLGHLATQIVNSLHSPTILLIQEAEDQDICTVSGAALSCGASNHADGKPDTLQDLALAIKAIGGPTYVPVYDRDGADARGIVSAFMYRADRVELLPATADDPVLGSTPDVVYPTAPLAYNTQVQNPKVLNAVLAPGTDPAPDGNNVFTRAPQVGLFRIWRGEVGKSVFQDVYAVSNHFSSVPDTRVGQRREQARYNAAIADAIMDANATNQIILGGDLNVFPRPDDPFRPGDAQFPSDQLAPLYQQGLINLFDVLVQQVPASAYSYVFDGQAQTLDHLFVTSNLRQKLNEMRAAHINADFPSHEEADGARGVSDHDPQAAKFDDLPTIESVIALLRYYIAQNGPSGQPAVEHLLKPLEKAAEAIEGDQPQKANGQLHAFLGQLRQGRGLTPAQLEALAMEVRVLLLLLEP